MSLFTPNAVLFGLTHHRRVSPNIAECDESGELSRQVGALTDARSVAATLQNGIALADHVLHDDPQNGCAKSLHGVGLCPVNTNSQFFCWSSPKTSGNHQRLIPIVVARLGQLGAIPCNKLLARNRRAGDYLRLAFLPSLFDTHKLVAGLVCRSLHTFALQPRIRLWHEN